MIIVLDTVLSSLGKLKRNPIDKMKISEIMAEEIRLKNNIDRIRKNINKLEKIKSKKFQSGVGADRIKKKMLFQEMKQLDLEAKMNLKNFTFLFKQYTFITNLKVIKNHEKMLKNTPIWNKLRNVEASRLEDYLNRIELKNKTFEQLVEHLNGLFETDIDGSEEFEDPEEIEMMKAWEGVESGEKDFEDIEEELKIKPIKEDEEID